MPKGAKPVGRFGSVNEPGSATGTNPGRKVSMNPPWKSVIVSAGAVSKELRIATPLYTAPLEESLRTSVAACGRSPRESGPQVNTVPSSVTRMNGLTSDGPPKDEFGSATIPVGWSTPVPAAFGTEKPPGATLNPVV